MQINTNLTQTNYTQHKPMKNMLNSSHVYDNILSSLSFSIGVKVINQSILEGANKEFYSPYSCLIRWILFSCTTQFIFYFYFFLKFSIVSL